MDRIVRVAYIDDEPIMLSAVDGMLQAWALERDVEITVDTFLSGRALLENSEGITPYDIVLIDIALPGQENSGLQIAEQLRANGYDGLIAFVTAHSAYMPQAFSVEAFAYVDKMHLREELTACMERVLHKLACSSRACMLLTDKGITTAVALADVLYVSSDRNYCHLHLNSKVIRTRQTLSSLVASLPSVFVQTRRTELANFQHVVSVHPKHIVLDDGTELPTGPTFRANVRKQFHAMYR